MSKRREKMTNLINKLDINGLEKLWIRIKSEDGNGGIYTLRELAMNRMEEINAIAFDKWLDSDDDSDFSFFH